MQGLVVKSTGSWYYIRNDSGSVIPCKIRGNFRIKGIRATNPVAVGDQVNYELQEEGTGIITGIEERKNYIIRRSSNLSKEYQLLATNIDQAILIVTLQKPRTLFGFVDRFLVSAEAFRIPVILLFNKIDLYSEKEMDEMQKWISIYENAGYSCLAVSLETGENTDELSSVFKNCLSVVAGNSGVGKSTLINFLDPSLKLRTNNISNAHQMGQHTTTFAEMFFLESGGKLIDTPGIKGFGMVDIEKEELFHFFPEIFRASEGCKFHNCLHINEPGCAVLERVYDGAISESRYLNYLGMLEDMGDKYRK